MPTVRVRKRAPLFQTYSGLRPWKGKVPALREGERYAKQPLFMSYTGLGVNQPERSRAAAGRDPQYAMRYGRSLPVAGAPQISEPQRQRTHETGMVREARAGDVTAKREAWFRRMMEQYIAAGKTITPELEASLRKAAGLGGVGAPSRGRQFGEYTARPGEAPRAMPGKVTGREQTIYGDLPKNYYERQSEMSRKGLVLVNGRWMTREMRDQLSRHKWGKVTQERIDRIEGGKDKSFFNFTTPSGETVKLSGAEMRAITALAESAKRGTTPEGLQLTPEQITNIRRYHEVVERGGEAARVDQAEAEYERQLDRLGEWQDVAGPLQRELGSEYGAMQLGSGRAGDLGMSREDLGALRLSDEQAASPLMREYRGRVRGMGGIREGLMERATGALGEVDAARAATQTPRGEFRERLAMLGGPQPTGREGAFPASAANDIRRRMGQGAAPDERRPGDLPPQVPVGPFTEAPQAPLARSARPDWLSPTDDRMVDEKAWLKRIEPYIQPASGEGLPGIPQKKTAGELSLEQDVALKTAVGQVQGDPAIGGVLAGVPTANIAAAVAAIGRIVTAAGVSISQVVQALRAAAGEDPEAQARAEQIISQLPPEPTGAPATWRPSAQPGAVAQTGSLEQQLGGVIDGIKQSGVGAWYSRDDFREPLIAQLTEPGSVLYKTVDEMIYQMQGQSPDVIRKAITDKIYNSLFNVLDDFALKNFGQNSKEGTIFSSNMMWIRPQNFASDVAGSVNQALQPLLNAKLGG